MIKSFKYRFIVSFVTIEIIFIVLIVLFNFSSITHLSKALVEEKIETSGKLFSELITTPLAVYDLATLDDALKSFTALKNVVAVKVYDDNHRVVAHLNNIKPPYKAIFETKQKELEVQNRKFRLSEFPITFDGKSLGHTEILFEITQSLDTIKVNRNWTLFFVVLEIVLSSIVAYIIGYRLTRNLNLLTSMAEKIANDDQLMGHIVGKDGDEISVLSQTLHSMKQRIVERNKNFNELLKEVQDTSARLLKERNFYTTLMNNAGSIILVMNTKGEIVICNKIVEDLTGYTQAELEGRCPWEIFTPKNIRQDVQNVFSRLIAGDFPSTYENIWMTKDGSDIPLAWSNSCIVDENGAIEYVIAIGADMTERKKIDQTIRALLNSPSDSIILIATDGTILEINEIAAKRFKQELEQLKGRKIFEFLSADTHQLRLGYMNQLIATKKAISFEEVAHKHIFKNHLYPILDNEGNVVQISIFSHDITESRKAEKELKKHMQLVDENVLISHTDLKGVTTSVSQAFCNITGYSCEELIGKEYNILRVADTPSSLYKDLWNTIQNGKVWKGEIKNRAKNGHIYWVDVTIYPDYDDNGNIIGYDAIRQDITNKKLIEELSITDTLTQLYNRRYFDETFYKALNSAKREKRIFALLSLDVDHFKKYNDTYGHQMGDKTLFSIAKCLKENMKRASDSAFRIGGEEFSAIYIIDRVENVPNVAQRIRLQIEEAKIEHKNNSASAYVTASIGVVYVNFEKNPNLNVDKEQLYKYADDLLYTAKKSGRNKVFVEEYHL